jgi:hypothetical protein
MHHIHRISLFLQTAVKHVGHSLVCLRPQDSHRPAELLAAVKAPTPRLGVALRDRMRPISAETVENADIQMLWSSSWGLATS